MTKINVEREIHPKRWSRWCYPIMKDYKIVCCDCGLVHDMEFRVTGDYDHVEFRSRRNNRSTGQVRRHMRRKSDSAILKLPGNSQFE